jgi:hypothetical protein
VNEKIVKAHLHMKTVLQASAALAQQDVVVDHDVCSLEPMEATHEHLLMIDERGFECQFLVQPCLE